MKSSKLDRPGERKFQDTYSQTESKKVGTLKGNVSVMMMFAREMAWVMSVWKANM
jgi:hypothetical protein